MGQDMVALYVNHTIGETFPFTFNMFIIVTILTENTLFSLSNYNSTNFNAHWMSPWTLIAVAVLIHTLSLLPLLLSFLLGSV